MKTSIRVAIATTILAMAAMIPFAGVASAHSLTDVHVVCLDEEGNPGIHVSGENFNIAKNSPITVTGPGSYLEFQNVPSSEFTLVFALGPNGTYHIDWPKSKGNDQYVEVECEQPSPTPTPTVTPTPEPSPTPTPTATVPPSAEPSATPTTTGTPRPTGPPTDTASETGDFSVPTAALLLGAVGILAATGLYIWLKRREYEKDN